MARVGAIWDLIGFLASALVLAAFFARDIVPLRALALCSNLAFLAYGLRRGIAPVWMLHALLLPVNCCRLAQAMGTAALRYTRPPRRLH
jgi:hypothetical protein